MATASRRWLELETVLDARFYRRVGIVSATDQVPDALATAAKAGLAVETVEPEKLPHVTFPADTVGIVETDAGVLLADQALRAAALWLARHPNVRLRPGCPVKSVDTGRVRITGETIGADLVLVAAGPWTRDLVQTPVTLHRQTMLYLRPPEHLRGWWETAPGVGRIGPDGRAWLLPPGAGTHLKISTDAACREVSTMDAADDVDWASRVLHANILTAMDDYEVVAVKDCHYASGPDGAVLTEAAPGVWARPACGGNGFAAAPLVAGQIVATMMEVAA
ncbi:hypothetical protein GCM10029964_057570 [Kibdelosporangium lantanae]